MGRISMVACIVLVAATMRIVRQSSADTATTEDAARAMLAAYLKPGADHAALTAALRPRPDDYATVFRGDAVRSAKEFYESAWDAGKILLLPRENQTHLLLFQATTEDLAGTSKAEEFPGWAQIADRLQPGVTWYRFKFVVPPNEPRDTRPGGGMLGTSADGLTFVNGHWALFPKPWLMLKQPAASGNPDSDAAGLKAYFTELLHALNTGEISKASTLAWSLIPDEATITHALRENVAKNVAHHWAAQMPKRDRLLPFDVDVRKSEVRVFSATTEDLAAYVTHDARQLPGGARDAAQTILRPGLVLYKVQLLAPGDRWGRSFALFFRDGTQWKFIGKIWRATL